MSEVKRFNNLGHPCRNGCFVGLDDFDAAQSELAALREELAKVIEDRARFPDRPDFIGHMIGSHIGNLKAQAVSAETYARKWHGRMTAAEQRNAQMYEFLERMLKGCGNDLLAAWQSEMEMVLVDAALKPTESGASE